MNNFIYWIANHSILGSTSKLLIEFMDGNRVESVIMRYGDVALDNYPFKTTDQGGEESDTEENDDMKSTTTATTTTTNTPFPNGRLYKSHRRATVCVSSQVGCAMGCTFCATGTMNLIANLQCGEILEQLCNYQHHNPSLIRIYV